MAIQKAVSANAYKKKNSATVLGAGNVTTTGEFAAVTNNLTLRSSVPDQVMYGSQVTDSYARKVISAGNFPQSLTGNYIVKGLSPTIAGQTNTLLRSGSSEYGQKRYPKPKLGDRRLHITSWSYTTGAATKGGSAGNTMSWGSADEAFGGTNAIPGELTYMITGLTPYNDDYKPRYL